LHPHASEGEILLEESDGEIKPHHQHNESDDLFSDEGMDLMSELSELA